MAGDVYDAVGWPDGRVGRFVTGELANHFALVVPDAIDTWLVFVIEDPDVVPPGREPHREDWRLAGGADALSRALAGGNIKWLSGDIERQVESRIFDLRRTWSTSKSHRRRRWRTPQ